METTVRPPIWRPLMDASLPGPRPLTITRMFLMSLSWATWLKLIAAACAATVVPFLAFLYPSVPPDFLPRHFPSSHGPDESVRVISVLFRLHLMWQIGRSRKGTPSNNISGVSSSGNMDHRACDGSTSTNFSPSVPSSFLGRDAIIAFLSSALRSRHVVHRDRSGVWVLTAVAARAPTSKLVPRNLELKIMPRTATRVYLNLDISS
uniref:Uncharacterized protein n=1 Tax=Rhipicephalus microplus TaxID=6941 RepID=A0A6G5A3F2_RHIMP